MYAMFPIEWRFGDKPTDGIGGPAVEDGGTLYVCRDEQSEDDYPQGDFDAGSLVFKTSLAEMVAECLDGWRTHDGFTDDVHVPASDALAAALRAAADMLDAGRGTNVRPNRATTSQEPHDQRKRTDHTRTPDRRRGAG